MQTVVVITPPGPVLELDLMKKHLRVDDDDSDDLISLYMLAAQANIDGPAGWLGRCLGIQTLELRLDSFYSQAWNWDRGLDWRSWESEQDWLDWCNPNRFTAIKLPYPPFISVTSIIYEDAYGVQQTLTSDGWTATDQGVEPAFGDVWPDGRIDADAVRIQYQAGYATLPAAITAALMMIVGDLWENRTSQVIDARAVVAENPTITALLGPYRWMNV